MAGKRNRSVDLDDESGELFPNLDLHDPKHKAVFAAAKKFHKAHRERQDLLSECKRKVDGLREKLLELMHGAQIEKFKFRGLVVERIPGRENVTVEFDEDVEPDDAGSEDE